MHPTQAKIPLRGVWISPDGECPEPRDPIAMRILLTLGSGAEEPATAADVAAIAADNEVIVIHAGGQRESHMLELGLRNHLPDRDIVSVLTQVVLAGDDRRPSAIAEARSMRTLVASGAVVICAEGGSLPVALDGDGTLHPVEMAIDGGLTAELLGRRLEVDVALTPAELETMGNTLRSAA